MLDFILVKKKTELHLCQDQLDNTFSQTVNML